MICNCFCCIKCSFLCKRSSLFK
uniref:Uncharacterized protein n=1 Tax=Rhizophora mucronata TaxID=61149 RepID=A0A2P2PT20_RHIMU